MFGQLHGGAAGRQPRLTSGSIEGLESGLRDGLTKRDNSSLSSDEQLLPAITRPLALTGTTAQTCSSVTSSQQSLSKPLNDDSQKQRSASVTHLSPHIVLVSLDSSNASRASCVSRLSGSAARSCSSSDSHSQRSPLVARDRLFTKPGPYPSGSMSLHVLAVQENGDAGKAKEKKEENEPKKDDDAAKVSLTSK